MDFDWTVHLQRVWTDSPYDSPEIHTKLRDQFAQKLDELKARDVMEPPLGWIVVGPAGSGKTHWLSVCRQQAVARGMGFVLVDLTDVREFWQTVLQGYLDSLQQVYNGGKFQQQVLMERFLGTLPLNRSVDATLEAFRKIPAAVMAENISRVIKVIHQRYPNQGLKYGDVIRALLATSSGDPDVASAGLSWLNANPVDDAARKQLGFMSGQEQPRKIVQALSWLMSLCAPTVLAFDQLDPIVSYLNLARQSPENDPSPEIMAAKSIFESLSGGLGAIRDCTFRTLSIAVCLDATWNALSTQTLAANLDRYEPSRNLSLVQTGSEAESIAWPRLQAAYDRMGFKPPYRTWPFKPSAFEAIKGLSPRQVLKCCEQHRQVCLSNGVVTELSEFKTSQGSVTVPVAADCELDKLFAMYKQQANPTSMLEEGKEDERLAPVLGDVCRAFLRELTLPEEVDAVVDEFPGGKTTKPLHARIRLIDHTANDREDHFCLRALQRTNAAAFQTRLKGVMTGAGIDEKIQFRRAIVLHTKQFPGGKITNDLIAQYQKQGGIWHDPKEEELRSLHAISTLVKSNPKGLDEWLKQRRPTSELPIFRALAPRLCKSPPEFGTGKTPSITPPSGGGSSAIIGPKPPVAPPSPVIPAISSTVFPIGHRNVGGAKTPVTMKLSLLEKHTVVLAGAGSGKTVLLKRIIEEAALRGTPSIVIDCANDLAALADVRTAVPSEWQEGDGELAKKYHAETEVLLWTPGRENGNPLVFEPVPDLSAVADDADELNAAIDMVRGSIGSIVAPGRGAAAQNKLGILTTALKFLAKSGKCSLTLLIELLSELPDEAGPGIKNQQKTARDMADSLKIQLHMNPLLSGTGAGLDPAILFGDDQPGNKKTRVSVISFIGLPGLESQQHFLNQLAMTLFAWIKRNPKPPERELRGLLVIDEAKDFIPSVKSTPCKVSLQRLAAQARKYHMGVVFATQNPKEIENTIIGNCSTQFYGKANAPNSQKVIKEQIEERGGNATDIASLQKGSFYFCNAEADIAKPVKLQVPLCLSNHIALDQGQIVERAVKSRETLKAKKS